MAGIQLSVVEQDREAPDFIVRDGGEQVGVEVTELFDQLAKHSREIGGLPSALLTKIVRATGQPLEVNTYYAEPNFGGLTKAADQERFCTNIAALIHDAAKLTGKERISLVARSDP